MIVARTGILLQPKTVSAHSFQLVVGSRKCSIGDGTVLAALKGTGVAFHVKDFGRCGSTPASSASLFLDRLLTTGNTGTSGWTYKVDNKAGLTGAADPTGPQGSGPLRGGEKVLWFWCVFDSSWACQRTLGISAPASAAAGATVDITVRAYDDAGVGIPAAKVRVTAGSASAVTSSAGVASLKLPDTAGSISVRAVDTVGATASKPQRVPAFPVAIAVS